MEFDSPMSQRRRFHCDCNTNLQMNFSDFILHQASHNNLVLEGNQEGNNAKKVKVFRESPSKSVACLSSRSYSVANRRHFNR